MQRSTTALACAIVAITGTSASAQSIEWASPVDGDWGDGVNWVGGNVPDLLSESAELGLIGAYTVTSTAARTYGGLTISNPDASLELGNITHTLGGDIQNNGTIVVNFPDNVFDSVLSFSADASIVGTGEIRMLASGQNNDAQLDATGFTIAHGPNHTIAGSGRVLGLMINAGTVVGDDAGAGLELLGTITQTSNGIVGADGGNVILGNGSGTFGGELFTGNGGKIRVENGTATVGDLENSGELEIDGQNATLVLSDSILNTGSILVNANDSVFNARVRLDADATIAGAGEVVMQSSGSSNDAQLLTAAGVTGTIGASMTVRGSGQVNGMSDAGVGGIVNNGMIVADDADEPLVLQGMHLPGAGIYLADGGVLELSNGSEFADISFDSSGDGAVDIGGGLVTFGTISNLGTMRVPGNGRTLSLLGPLNNAGELLLNPGGLVFNATVRFDADTSITGAGSIRLLTAGITNDAQLRVADGFTGTIGSGQTVAGSGEIVAEDGATLMNNGTIVADDSSGAELRLAGAHDGSGGGVYRSENGGLLNLLGGMTLTGGTLATDTGGQIAKLTNGTATLVDVTNTGDLNIFGQGSTIELGSDLISNGAIRINSNLGVFNATLSSVVEARIDGTGTIVMETAGNSNDARITANKPAQLTLGTGQTLIGDGQLNGSIVIEGVVDPAGPSRTFTTDSFTLTGSSETAIDIGGVDGGTFDRFSIRGGETATLDGTLTVNIDDGYVPVFGDTWDIIDGESNGLFGEVLAPTAPLGQVYRVIYGNDRVYVILTCDADLSGDGVIDFFDVSSFLNFFSSEDVRGDLNGDGDFNFFDVSLFLQLFGQGCDA